MKSLIPRPQHPRRGVTLVEMLVVVALLVLMMTIIVQIFQAATGSVTAAKAYQELDDELRELDSTLRQDLQGATAQFKPPLDPDQNLGYFEYIENSWQDAQGEDTDDCLRFTAQAPAGMPFTGRMYVYTFPTAAPFKNNSQAALNYFLASQPITITSEYAEIIYFLRNGNLYRRVLLIAPERQSAVNLAVTGANNTPASQFNTGLIPGGFVASWQGVNDLSAHPSPRGNLMTPPILNTLGDLTNRENRAFLPRFSDDYDGNGVPDDYNLASNQTNTALNGVPAGDGVPDYYPTLYPNVFNLGLVNVAGVNYPKATPTAQNLAFPFIYPGAYSQPDPNAIGSNRGWIHVPDPSTKATSLTANRAPLDVGDSLLPPISPGTWWGFPTWRETMSANWLDPVWQIQWQGGAQAVGVQPFISTSAIPTASTNLLPAANYWFNPPLYSDGYGASSAFLSTYFNSTTNLPVQAVWDDDLIMTGVRSFDVKGYDDSVATYVDLGNSPANTNVGPNATPDQLVVSGQNFTTSGFANFGQALSVVTTSLGHEGVMPPRSVDFRVDYQAAKPPYGIFIPIGDDDAKNVGVIRLRRTYDTWSTEYTQAPAKGYDPSTAGFPQYGLGVYAPGSDPFGTASTTVGPGYNTAGTIRVTYPLYPSYPPPYDVALRGIQIQVRVVDPRNERIKVLTIRQDFSDKISTNP